MVVDVSVWQGSIDWSAVKAAGVELAIIKATEGIGFTDPRFAANWAGAKAAGVPRGAYAFVHPDAGNNPIAEADYFVAILKAHGLDAGDVLAEDYEVPGGGAAWSLAWLGRVQAQTAILPEFYSNYSGCFHVASDARMARYPLWLAYPGDGVHIPPCPAPWSAIRLLQYAVGRVPGISGNVDEDVNLGLFTAATQTLTAPPRRRNPMLAYLNGPIFNQFGRGTDGAVWHIRSTDSGATWSSEAILGQTGSAVNAQYDPEVAVLPDGRIIVFIVGTDGRGFKIASPDLGATWEPVWLEYSPGAFFTSPIIVTGGPASPTATVPVDLTPVLSAVGDLKTAIGNLKITGGGLTPEQDAHLADAEAASAQIEAQLKAGLKLDIPLGSTDVKGTVGA